MTQDEIDEIIVGKVEDYTCAIGDGAKVLFPEDAIRAMQEAIAEIQRTQEPVAVIQRGSSEMVECVYKGQLTPIDGFSLTGKDVFPRFTSVRLFTFPPAPVVPEGWQLVPKTLSLEMYATFMKAYCEGEELRECLKQAIAAAPEYK